MTVSNADHLAPTGLTPQRYFLLAAGLSAAMLGAAFTFQYAGELYPCVLCIYQRIPYAVVIVFGLIGVVAARDGGPVSNVALLLAAACALAFLVDAGIAGFHVGVELGWWTGTDSCVGEAIDTSSIEAMREAILNAPVVRCDEVAWSMAGISMAGWNGLIAIAIAAASVRAIARWRRA
jgi:disulfide bond formation protein DsbB